MSFNFKNATSEDFHTFKKLFEESRTIKLDEEKTTMTREPLTLGEYVDWLKDSTIILMFRNDECVGYAEVSYDAYNKGDEQIVEIFVPENFRRKGFGRQLVGQIEDKARTESINMLWTESEDMETDQFWTDLSYRYNNQNDKFYKIITPKNEL